MSIAASNTVKEYDPKTLLSSMHCDSDATAWLKLNGLLTCDHVTKMVVM